MSVKWSIHKKHKKRIYVENKEDEKHKTDLEKIFLIWHKGSSAGSIECIWGKWTTSDLKFCNGFVKLILNYFWLGFPEKDLWNEARDIFPWTRLELAQRQLGGMARWPQTKNILIKILVGNGWFENYKNWISNLLFFVY